ncbi:hypothetical protein M8C21_029816 [Ambrosia artemisiifolia]|uniref:RNA polymerase Rpb5 N-terminal domain-containing protein n=1 Tax=Ambrosia artemisiifolia TaxID=4212 RepID=A0AAD5C088_AMBAR|nr:hypothetical protein M8C21_029816 [Ambrosia artemisiifolia]
MDENGVPFHILFHVLFSFSPPPAQELQYGSKAKKTNDSSDQIYVFFPEELKVGVKTLKTYTERMKSENVFQAILFVRENLTPFARTCMSEIATKFHLEVFQLLKLLRQPRVTAEIITDWEESSIHSHGRILPFILGIGVSFVLRGAINEGPFIVFMGVAMSIIAFPILAPTVNDIAAWILLALAVALSATGRSPLAALWVFLCGLAFIVLCSFVIPPIFNWMARSWREAAEECLADETRHGPMIFARNFAVISGILDITRYVIRGKKDLKSSMVAGLGAGVVIYYAAGVRGVHTIIFGVSYGLLSGATFKLEPNVIDARLYISAGSRNGRYLYLHIQNKEDPWELWIVHMFKLLDNCLFTGHGSVDYRCILNNGMGSPHAMAFIDMLLWV